MSDISDTTSFPIGPRQEMIQEKLLPLCWMIDEYLEHLTELRTTIAQNEAFYPHLGLMQRVWRTNVTGDQKLLITFYFLRAHRDYEDELELEYLRDVVEEVISRCEDGSMQRVPHHRITEILNKIVTLALGIVEVGFEFLNSPFPRILEYRGLVPEITPTDKSIRNLCESLLSYDTSLEIPPSMSSSMTDVSSSVGEGSSVGSPNAERAEEISKDVLEGAILIARNEVLSRYDTMRGLTKDSIFDIAVEYLNRILHLSLPTDVLAMNEDWW